MSSKAEAQAKFLCQAKLQLEGKAWSLKPDEAQMKHTYFCHFGEAKAPRVMLLLNHDVYTKESHSATCILF